jgi:hypothetical protein
MTTSTRTPRQSFRETVAAVADKARLVLPASVNGRIESAVKLVLAGDVFFCADGTVEVGSSDPTRYYKLVGHSCTCTDFTSGKAPEGMCKHRLAANLLKSAERVLARHGTPEPEPLPEPPPVEPWPDNDPETLPADDWPPEEEVAVSAPVAPAPLPEAAFSLTLKGTLNGVEALLTARGQTAAEFKANLEAIRGLLDRPQPQAQPGPQLSPQQMNAAAMHRPVTGFCPVHQVQMRWNEGKDGRKGWHSHRNTDGSWCKGR